MTKLYRMLLNCQLMMRSTRFIPAIRLVIIILIQNHDCSAIDSAELDSLIYSSQYKYCGNLFCNVDDSYEPQECPMTIIRRPTCRVCSCADGCQIYGTCCADKHIGAKYFFECDKTLLKNSMGMLESYIPIVKSCPKDVPNFSPELGEKCRKGKLGHLDDGRMVNAYIDNANVTFRNKYCAECNGVTEYTPWDVYISCDEEVVPSKYSDMNAFIRAVEGDLKCNATTNHENVTQREICDAGTDFISSCNTTGEWQEYDATTEKACHYYLNPVHRYRNLFCAICNGVAEFDLRCPTRPSGGYVDLQHFKPFSAILNFARSDVEVISDSERFPVTRMGRQDRHQCREGDVYDTLTKQCREVYCSLSSKINDNACFKLLHSEAMVLTTVYLTVFDSNPEFIPQLFHLYNFDIEAIYSLKTFLSPIGFGIYKSYKETYARELAPSNFSVEVALVKLTLDLRPHASLETARTKLRSMTKMTWETVRSGQTIELQAVHGHDPNVTDDLIILPFAEEMGRLEPALEKAMQVPLDFNVSCPMLKFGVNELNILLTQFQLGIHDYFPHDEYVYVCVEATDQTAEVGQAASGHTLSQESIIERIITVVCFACGISFLMVTFLVYICLKQLRNVPGLNLSFLCLSLVLSQSFYLFGAGAVATPIICTILGVLIHYFWLVAFAWMNICCFHMFRVFNNLFKSLDYAEETTQLLLQYSGFAFIVPLLIVGATIATSYITSHEGNIGYGGPSLCFVAQGWTSVISFGIPAATTVVTNTVLLIYTIVKLKKSDNDKIGQAKTGADDISRFFKLSTMTGLSWLFGFLGYFLQRVEFLYVFTVLTASQGVFIFLSFVLSRRIWRMLREQCCQKDQRASSYVKSPQVTENTAE